MMKQIKRLRDWFLSEDKAFSRQAVYMLLIVILALLFYLFADFGAAGYDHNDPPVKFFVICMVLVAVFLVMLFISHLIIFTVHKKRKKRQNTIMNGIPGAEGFAKVKPLRKGWSGDKKYIVEDKDGRRLLLRVSDIKKQAEKKTEFEMMGRVAARAIPTPVPVDFGVCHGGKSVYSLMTWIEGRDAGAVLLKMSEREQYLLGKKAGALQRAIHAIPVQADAEDWSVWFGRRVQEKLNIYYAHERELAGAAPCADYLLRNRNLLENRPQVFYHGDLNPTNIILMPDGRVAAIDYCTRDRHGTDPVREFCTIPWGKNPNPYFYTGALDGYYEGCGEDEFLTELAVLAYYFAYEAVWAIVDSRDPKCNMKKECRKHMKNVLRWYDGMKNPVPSWYLKELKHEN